MIFAIIVVLSFSFIFSGTEAALLSLPAGEELSEDATKVSSALKKTLCSLVLGNNVVNIAGSIALGQLASNELSSFSQSVFPFVFTILVIIFGEIIPKSIGEARSVQVIQLMAKILLFFNWCFAPFNYILSWFLKWLPQKETVVFEEDIVVRARQLDTLPVSKIMEKYDNNEPKRELLLLSEEVTCEEALKILHDEGPQNLINRRGEITGYIDRHVAFEWLFTIFDSSNEE